jgi:hypothetical protein
MEIDPAKFQVIGSGAYGAVIQPALPNVNNEGNPIDFGKNTLTKVLLRKKNYNKSMQNAKTIAEKIPSLAIPYTPYIHNYSEENIKSIKGISGISVNMNKFSEKGDKDGIYMFRMPNLGIDLFNIIYTPKLVERFLKIQTTKLLENLISLFQVVKDIKDAGYIHRDIHMENVLLNADTGIFTIIDFDLLTTKDEYLNLFSFGKWNPPEKHIFLLKEKAIYSNQKQYLKDRFFELNESAQNTIRTINTQIKNTSLERQKQIYDNMKEKMLNTNDSYGLAFSLLPFLMRIKNSEFQQKVQGIIEKMGDYNYESRMDIDTAIEELNKLIPPKTSESSSTWDPKLIEEWEKQGLWKKGGGRRKTKRQTKKQRKTKRGKKT